MIATAVTVPLVIIVALVIGALDGSGGPDSTANPTAGALPALTPSAPPHASAETAACAKVLETLPVTLDGLDPRIVHPKPDTPFVVAWGDPAIVLSCGVDRPKDLVPGSSARFTIAGPTSGPYYDVQTVGDSNVFTTVDRAAYISISVPTKYQGADVLPPLSRDIAAALPAVCIGTDTTPDVARLCTRRK